MAVQLPEPDYYTIEEVLKRWEISEAVLLRLAREGKIRIGFNPPYPYPVSVFGAWVDDDAIEHEEEIPLEILNRQTLYTLDDTANNIIWTTNPILLHSTGVPNNEEPAFAYRRSFFPSTMLLWPNKTIPWIDSFPDDWFLMVPISIQAEFLREYNDERDLRTGIVVANQGRIPIHQLIVPTFEIHRIERQHETAQEAADADVLGVKEKEKYQSMIAAMAEIIASKAPAYRHGDRPNAAQIADALAQTGITDREKSTMAREITAALKKFGR